MRIALLSRGFPPENPDGIPQIRRVMARELAARGHEVHVFRAGRVMGSETHEGYRVHRIPENLPTQFFFPNQPYANQMLTWSQAVHEMIRSVATQAGEFDVMDAPLWEIEGFVPVLEAPEVPAVVRVETTSRHLYEINGFAFDERRNFENELERLYLRRAAGVLFDSESARSELFRLYGDDAVTGLAEVIYHGVPVPDAPVAAAEMGDKAGPEAGDEEVVVLSVNRHEKRKGTLHLFQVMAEALQLKPSLRFRLVGRDNSGHDGFAAEQGRDYPAYFRDQYPGLEKAVTFLGEIPEEQVEAEYAAADIVLNCSVYESFGLTYAEAMGHGKPVVAFEAGASPELFHSGEDGQLIPLGDVKSMAQALVLLADNPQERKRLGRAARRTVETRFAPAGMVDRVLQLYDQVMKQS